MSRSAASPTADPELLRSRVQRRTLRVVMAAQVLGGAGLAAGITVGALLAEQMLGSESLSGLPAALFTVGSALAAFGIGRVSQRAGRRVGLGAGFLIGGLGAAGVVVAAALDSPVLLFASLFVYGGGTAANLQARYAGTDLALPDRRGAAVSRALVATTFGAVAGPNLVTPTGAIAQHLGLPALAGPFLLAALAYLAAGTVLVTMLRPDPLLLARRLGEPDGAAAPDRTGGGIRRGVYVGAGIMLLTQLVMTAVMTMTPIHMRGHHHELGAVGLVIGLHIAAMYLPSPLTGLLVDRIGRIPTAVASGVVLAAAGVLAALAPGDSVAAMVVALMLLGLGWNLGLIAGTALVVDATVPANRARVQGTIDVAIALSGATGGAVSGLVVAAWGFAALGLGAMVLTLVLLPGVMALGGRGISGPGGRGVSGPGGAGRP